MFLYQTLFGLLSIPTNQPLLWIAVLKAATYCDPQEKTPNPDAAFPDVYRGQNEDEGCPTKEQRAFVLLFPLAGQSRVGSHVLPQPWLHSSPWAAGRTLPHTQQIWLRILPSGSSESGSYKQGMKCHSFSCLFCHIPLGCLPSMYCLGEMQHRIWPLTLSRFTVYRLQMTLKRFVCMFSILICPFDKIRAICINNSLSFKLTQKFPSSRYCCQICFSQNSISPGASSEYNSKWNAR